MDKKNTGEQYICFKVSRVMKKIQRYYETNLSSFGITPVQFYVLNTLWVKDGIKFKDLARSLEMEGSTLTGILDRLERLDYVERRDDPEDRRSLLIFLKEKAKENRTEIVSLADRLNDEIKEKLPKKEIEIFESLIDKLAENI